MTMRRLHPPAGCLDWAYFLDVDGTLLDIAETPDAVHVDAEMVVTHPWANLFGRDRILGDRRELVTFEPESRLHRALTHHIPPERYLILPDPVPLISSH